MKIVVDAHQHFWDRSRSEFDYSWQESPELRKICRSFMPPDLRPLIDRMQVHKTVFVQTQHNLDENRWALRLCEQFDWIAGIVGWVDLISPDCEGQLAAFTDHPKFVGVRHIVQDEADPDFILREDVGRGLSVLERSGVPFDLLFYEQHVHHAATIASRFPNLRLVINHLSKPKIKTGEIGRWQRHLKEAAKCPNVWCKLSGLVTEADWSSWTTDDLKPYVQTAIECFGPRRCLFGSDWPVCLLAATYEQVCESMMRLISDLNSSDQAGIMGGNAIEFYRLRI